MGVQVFGSRPERMGDAAKRIVDKLQPDFIDINCGCPADKIVDQCAGSSLLRDTALLTRILKATREAVHPLPVTIKIRTGWDAKSINAQEVARIAEAEGAESIAIHGRTREQGYRGDADWGLIESIASERKIPVIGNGGIDIRNAQKFIRDDSPVAGFMIGRAALGYPWIFRDLKAVLKGETLPPLPTPSQRWATVFRYVELLQQHRPDRRDHLGIGWMRAKIKALTNGLPNIKAFRPHLDAARSMDEVREIARLHMDQCEAVNQPLHTFSA